MSPSPKSASPTNLERTSIYQLKQSLLATTTDAERATGISRWPDRTSRSSSASSSAASKTRDILANRPSSMSDRRVRRRGHNRRTPQGQCHPHRQRLRNASDELKSIINDPELTTGGEALLVPADAPVDEPITFSLLDALTAAIDNRPELQRALLNIQDASIRRQVADSLRLPLLDLTAQARFQGLNEDLGEAYEDITEAQFVDLLAGIRFEQPIGNRAGEAQYRQRQLELMQASVDYRAAVQRIVLEVKRALRQVETNYKLIEQSRTARLAATENVRTLQVLERTTQALSPDFLDLKFRRQESLANAELEEAQALVNYQIALAELVAATGTALERNGIRFVVPEAAEPSP
ncbi:MAG: TolC family protein [Phycisphaerales bacterium]